MYLWYNIHARSRDYCCSGKAIFITYSECVFVSLVIQHAERICRVILSSMGCLCLPHSSTLFRKRHDFSKILTEHKMCVLIFSTTLSETFRILRRTERDVITRPHVKYPHPLFSSDIDITLIFSTGVLKILKFQISLISFQLDPSCAMQTDGQTWQT